MTEIKATIHLIVLQHGLWGHSGDVAKLTDFLRNAFQVQGQEPDEIVLLNSEVNSRRLTYDGIDVCGARLAQLVQDTIQQYADHGRKVVKLSLIGERLILPRCVLYLSHLACICVVQTPAQLVRQQWW